MNDDGTVRTVKSKPAIGVPDLVVEVGRIFRFGLVGVLATLVYALTAAVAVEIFLIPPVPASILAQAMSAGVSYVGHSTYTFRVKADHRGFLWRFMIIAGLTFATTVGVTWFCTDIARMSHLTTIAIVTVLIPVINYACNRFWVFRSGLGITPIDPSKRRSANISQT